MGNVFNTLAGKGIIIMVEVINFPARILMPLPEKIVQADKLGHGVQHIIEAAKFFSDREKYADEVIAIANCAEEMARIHKRICIKIRGELN